MTLTITAISGARVRCQHCVSTADAIGTMSAPDAARATGWRVWEGVTIGGRHECRVICPACLTPREEDESRSWDAECHTCAARASDEYPDGEVLSEDDVRDWRGDHRCDPDVDLISPEQARQDGTP